jgi:hypothetical protein
MSLRAKPRLTAGKEAPLLLGLPHTLRVFAMTNEIMSNHSVKEGGKGSGGSPGKTLKRNLYPLNCVGSLPKITRQRAGWPIGMTSMTALQGFEGRTFRSYQVKYHPMTEGFQ